MNTKSEGFIAKTTGISIKGGDSLKNGVNFHKILIRYLALLTLIALTIVVTPSIPVMLVHWRAGLSFMELFEKADLLASRAYWLQVVAMMAGGACARERRLAKKRKQLGITETSEIRSLIGIVPTTMTPSAMAFCKRIRSLIKMLPMAMMVATTLAAIIVVVASSDVWMLYEAGSMWSSFYCGYIVWVLLEQIMDLFAEIKIVADNELDDESGESNDEEVD